jgi:hypothetical protein
MDGFRKAPAWKVATLVWPELKNFEAGRFAQGYDSLIGAGLVLIAGQACHVGH